MVKAAVVFNLAFILVSGQSFPTVSWHGYDPDLVEALSRKPSCDIFQNTTRAQLYLGEQVGNRAEEFGLWPGLLSSEGLAHGETLFGFKEATEIIWKNQNPEDCSTAKYMVVGCYKSGFGSTVHVEASLLSLALKLGRVYLRYPEMCEHKWIVNNQASIITLFLSINRTRVSRFRYLDFFRRSGQGKSDMECYYEPFSRCTIDDALETYTGQMLTLRTIPDINYRSTAGEGSSRVSFEQQIYEESAGHRTVVISNPQALHGRNFIIPDQFKNILACLPMIKSKWFYWWRAVSATYFMRPNKITLNYLDKFRTLPIKTKNQVVTSAPNKSNGQCIAMYVRRADKGKEMSLLPFSRYAEAVEALMAGGHLNKTRSNNEGDRREGSEGKPLIFIGTEDVSVLREATEWGEREGYQIAYTDLMDRSTLHAAKGTNQDAPFSHPLEYVSMLLNLEYAVKCDAYIGTLASNWCRLVDELRATVGGGANRPYVDLSRETCGRDMCVNGGVKDFGW